MYDWREACVTVFIEVKNTSLQVSMGAEVKPVAQAIREAHIKCNVSSNQDIQVQQTQYSGPLD